GARSRCSKQHTRCLHPSVAEQDRGAGRPQAAADHSWYRLHHARGGWRVKTRSIGFRLAAWYFVVFACGVTVFSIAAWFAMRASLYHAIDESLADRVYGVQSFMDRQIASLSIPEIRDEFREHSVFGPGG